MLHGTIIELKWSHVTFPYVPDAAAGAADAPALRACPVRVEPRRRTALALVPGRKAAPGFAGQCRQLTEARRDNEWLGSGNADVQQQALKDFAQAKNARFTSGFGEPTWRKKYRHEGFRVIGTDRVPEFATDGGPKLSAKTGRQVMGRSVVVHKLNRRWAQVKVPGCGWVRFRLTRPELPTAKTFRVTLRNGQWHVAFAVIPAPAEAPGTDEVIGIDRGVKITAALSDGRKLNCPQLTVKERAQVRKHQRRAARAPKGSEQKTAEYAKVARLKAREAVAQGLVREDQHDAGPHLRPGAVREAEHQEHDPLGQGNRRAARQAGQAESRTEPGDPRAGLGPAAAAHRTQGPRPGRRRPRPLHLPALLRLRMDRQELAQEPSRVRLLLLRLHLQRRYQRSNQRRGRTGRDSPPPAISRCRRDDNGHQPFEHP